MIEFLERAGMNWLGYAKTHRERTVIADLLELGVEAHAPLKVELVRRGKKRRPEPVESPVLPNVVCIRGDAEDFHKLAGVKDLTPTFMGFSDKTWDRYVAPFLDQCAESYRRTYLAIEAGEMADQFKPGEAVQIIAGPFAEKVAKFVATVENARDIHPKIVAEIELFGRSITGEFDPINVKRAG